MESKTEELEDRIQRIEFNLAALMRHLGLRYVDARYEWIRLASLGSEHKLAAIKAHRKETGSDLAAAKKAVEEFHARSAP